ncbi:hypothetical protein JCM3765_001422 [Sporobolomyces pararoseus]
MSNTTTVRTDRSNQSLRPLAISQSLLSRSDGSSQFSFGNVTVLSSVTGPVEVRLREELVDKSTLEFNLLPLIGLPGPKIKSLESTIRQLFSPLILSSLYPRSLIQITCQTISSPTNSFSEPFSTSLEQEENLDLGSREKKKKKRRKLSPSGGASEQAARINSITLALLDSGVQLKGLLISVALAFLPSTSSSSSSSEEEEEEEILVLDPTINEEETSCSTHVITVSFGQGIGGTKGEIVGIDSIGKFNQNQLFEVEDLGLKACSTILGFVRKSIEAKYGLDPSNSTSALSSTSTTTRTTRDTNKEIKMCVAEDGDEMSDLEPQDDDDQVMI